MSAPAALRRCCGCAVLALLISTGPALGDSAERLAPSILTLEGVWRSTLAPPDSLDASARAEWAAPKPITLDAVLLNADGLMATPPTLPAMAFTHVVDGRGRKTPVRPRCVDRAVGATLFQADRVLDGWRPAPISGDGYGREASLVAGDGDGGVRRSGVLRIDGAFMSDLPRHALHFAPPPLGDASPPIVAMDGAGAFLGIATHFFGRAEQRRVVVAPAAVIARYAAQNCDPRRPFVWPALGLSVDDGTGDVRVQAVSARFGAGAPVAVAAGDTVLRLDDDEIQSAAHLRRLVAMRPPGTRLSLTLGADGREWRVETRLFPPPYVAHPPTAYLPLKRPDDDPLSSAFFDRFLSPFNDRNAVRFRAFRPHETELFAVDRFGDAPVAVAAYRVDRTAVVARGDRLVAVDDRPVKTVADAIAAFEALGAAEEGDIVRLTLTRRGRLRTARVERRPSR